MAITDTAIPGRKPTRTNSRKRFRRKAADSLTSTGAPPITNNGGEKRAQQINAYYDLKKNSPALKAARTNRMKRLNAAKWTAAQASIPVQWRAVMVVVRVILMSLVLFVMFRIMLKEKQLLALKGVLTLNHNDNVRMQSKMSWKTFDHAYETRFRRRPVEDYKAWLTFAQQESCEPFKLYTAIERDLMPFRKKLRVLELEEIEEEEKEEVAPIDPKATATKTNNQHPKQPHLQLLKWNNLEAIATNYTAGAYLLVQIRDNALTIIDQDWTDWYDQHPTPAVSTNPNGYRARWEARKVQYNLEWLMDPVLHHQPPITTRFVVNLHHRPKSPIDAVVPIFSSHHEHPHTDADPTHPGTLALNIANKNRNGIVDPRDATTRDLLLPHLYVAGGRMGAAGMTSSPSIGGFWFWPFFRQGQAWEKRNPTIVWRGSTLGNYHKNRTTATGFFEGPRFDMMKRWGGTDVHPIASNVNVDVDFAFTKLIVQGEATMDQQQTKLISEVAHKEYRFAKRMSYGKMQHYQYLMDVDSNAFSVRFSALLRSGSLIFKSTRYREWYSERVLAWRDYIPVNHDASGIAEKLQWTSTQDPDVINDIIMHGKSVVERHIRPEDMQCYTYRMMLEYVQLFDPASFPATETKEPKRSLRNDNN